MVAMDESDTFFDGIIIGRCRLLVMATRSLNIRVDEVLHNRLNTLKRVVKVSINQLVCEAVEHYVAERRDVNSKHSRGG